MRDAQLSEAQLDASCVLEEVTLSRPPYIGKRRKGMVNKFEVRVPDMKAAEVNGRFRLGTMVSRANNETIKVMEFFMPGGHAARREWLTIRGR